MHIFILPVVGSLELHTVCVIFMIHTTLRKNDTTMALLMPAPRRCFLRDVEHCISNHQREQQKSQTEEGITCILPNQALTLRLLGTVVSIQEAAIPDSTRLQKHLPHDITNTNTVTETCSIALDDGTALLAIEATRTMIAQIRLRVGWKLDCIVRVELSTSYKKDSSPGDLPFHAATLVANQLAVVRDVHAESLRWLELAYRQKLRNEGLSSDSAMPSGFPTRAVSSEDVLRIILYECQSSSSTGSNRESNKRNQTQKISTQRRGVSIEDLAECLELSLVSAEAMLQELQSACQIYKNEAGLYVPL